MEEIQDSVLDMALFGAEFINAIAQIIRRGPPEFVAKLGQQLDARSTAPRGRRGGNRGRRWAWFYGLSA